MSSLFSVPSSSFLYLHKIFSHQKVRSMKEISVSESEFLTPILDRIHFNINTVFIHIKPFLHAECPPPPSSNSSTWTIEFTHFEYEHWTFTEVSYTCNPGYTFLQGEVDRRVCGAENEDGVWDDYNAPVCAPGNILFCCD